MLRKIFPTLVVGAWLGAVSAAHAQLIVSDGFNYAPGAISNASGGSGWPNDGSHNWFTSGGTTAVQTTSGGLTFTAGGTALATAGGKLTTTGSDAGAFRNLPTASGLYGGDNNQGLWVSFLASNTSASNQSGYAGLSLINAFTSNGTYTQSENLFVGQINGTGQYGFVDSASNSSNRAALLTGISTGTATHLLVMHLDFTASGSTEISLYVDPTPGVEPVDDPQAIEDYTDGFVFNQVRFQSGSASAAAFNFDELRLGSTYGDVTPVATVVAPEPKGAITLCLGGLLLTAGGVFRRMRRI